MVPTVRVPAPRVTLPPVTPPPVSEPMDMVLPLTSRIAPAVLASVTAEFTPKAAALLACRMPALTVVVPV